MCKPLVAEDVEPRNHYFMANGINAGPVAAEFLQHAGDLTSLLVRPAKSS